jgi:probable phosphoglycerate mutase
MAARLYHGAVNSERSEPTVLFLVRHGEAESNRDGRFGGWTSSPLTEVGRQQALRTAGEVQRRQPTVLITSDLERARQTAAPIAGLLGLEPVFEPGLRERTLGVFDGLSFAEAEAQYPELWKRLAARDPTAVPEGGESAGDVYGRVSRAIQKLIVDHAGQRIVVVSHGLAMFHAFTFVCGLGVPHNDLPVFMLVDNGSISQFENRGPRWRIRSINDIAHLRDIPTDPTRTVGGT